MKLKEKLAEDHLLEHGIWNERMDGYLLTQYSEIYLAGFKKAREMAVHIANDNTLGCEHDQPDMYESEKREHAEEVLTNSVAYAIAAEIENLGEEKVE